MGQLTTSTGPASRGIRDNVEEHRRTPGEGEAARGRDEYELKPDENTSEYAREPQL
jgi:hypothetical protein